MNKGLKLGTMFTKLKMEGNIAYSSRECPNSSLERLRNERGLWMLTLIQYTLSNLTSLLWVSDKQNISCYLRYVSYRKPNLHLSRSFKTAKHLQHIWMLSFAFLLTDDIIQTNNSLTFKTTSKSNLGTRCLTVDWALYKFLEIIKWRIKKGLSVLVTLSGKASHPKFNHLIT